MLGLGSQRLGTSPAGLGQPDTVETFPSTRPGARYIGPDGNPVIDPVNGGFLKADSVAIRVYIAIKTTLGAASGNPKLGVKWPKKIDARFESELSASISAALSNLVATRQIRFDAVAVEYPQPERYIVSVEYFNLVTQKSEQVAVNGSI